MTDEIIPFDEPVTLLGGGAAEASLLHDMLKLAPVLIAADGGANMAIAEALMPERVIGDFDSVTPETLAAIPAGRHVRLAEQETTDFEKCLSRIDAPFVLGVGFLGARVDHTLAAWNVLVRHRGRRCILVGPDDVAFAAPDRLVLPLQPGTRLSLFPMAPVRGESRGLRWPIDGIAFAPGGRIGTSNEATGPVGLSFSGPGMLVILPRACLEPEIGRAHV